MEKALLELGIQSFDETLSYVDYTDGDVVIIDSVAELRNVSPIKADMNAILLCVAGRMRFDLNGRQLTLSAGGVLLIPPRVMLAGYQVSTDFECKILCLSNGIIQGLLRSEMSVWNQAVYVRGRNIFSVPEEKKRILTLHHALLLSKLTEAETKYRREIVQSLIRAQLFELCGVLQAALQTDGQGRQTRGEILFNRFLELLTTGRQKRQPVGYYAFELAVTPKYLTMVCEKYSGKPASEWIDQYVMEDVRYLLHETTLSVKEISSQLGFSNMSHFGTYVRRHTGLSPKAFRANKK